MSAKNRDRKNRWRCKTVGFNVSPEENDQINFAVKLSGRYIKPCKSTASERVIYLSALTPRGEVFYGDTIDKMCDEKVVILDEYGTVSNIIFSYPILNNSLINILNMIRPKPFS